MAKKFRDLLARMPEERQARLAAETRRIIDEMPLQELRKALELTQQQVAATLGINQVAVSKMEDQTDLRVSTLRRFVEAMGGQLRIVAHFPEGAVEIGPFKREREPEPTEPAAAWGGRRRGETPGGSRRRFSESGDPRTGSRDVVRVPAGGFEPVRETLVVVDATPRAAAQVKADVDVLGRG